MSVTSEEIRSQPELWERAGALAASLNGILPTPGEDAAVIGCGTSWFMAQAYAALSRGQRPRPHRRVRRLGDAVAAL